MRIYKSTVAVATAAILSIGLSKAVAYTTPGNYQLVTLATLSQGEGTGVSVENGTYYLAEDLTIASTDTLEILPGQTLGFESGIALNIAGFARFGCNSGEVVTIMASDTANPPRGIRMTDGGSGDFRSVAFERVGLTSISANGVKLNDCSFENVSSSTNSMAALAFNTGSTGNIVTECTFTANESAAIGTAANAFCELTVKNCTFTDNNTANSNKPMLNLTTPGESGMMIIRSNVINGAKRTMVGGISVSNLVGGPVGRVIIEGNEVSDCRYGINCLGPVDVDIRNNRLIDNRYESNPMNGGSGISCTDYYGKLRVVMAGNHIEGSLWGVTLIGMSQGFDMISLGAPADSSIDSPGGNTFVANGNNGSVYDPSTPYDLYNNSPRTVYAQANTWAADEQTPEEIEKVIFHKADNPSLGEVIYQGGESGIDLPAADGSAATTIYDLSGRSIPADSYDAVSAPGLYIVRRGHKVTKEAR